MLSEPELVIAASKLVIILFRPTTSDLSHLLIIWFSKRKSLNEDLDLTYQVNQPPTTTTRNRDRERQGPKMKLWFSVLWWSCRVRILSFSSQTILSVYALQQHSSLSPDTASVPRKDGSDIFPSKQNISLLIILYKNSSHKSLEIGFILQFIGRGDFINNHNH